MTEMLSYRAYFLTESDLIRCVTGFKSADDDSACTQADFMLARSEYAAIESYQDWRGVLRRERQQQAA
jgi:hypothetical protein